MNTSEIRQRFAIPDDIIYFNGSYMGPQLKSATIKAYAELLRKESPWKYTKEDFFDHVHALQEKLAKLLGCLPEELAITPSVSYGIATAARGVEYYCEPGEILILDQQFPSNVYAWLELEKLGYQVTILKRDLSRDLTDQVLNALNKNTRVVAVGQCHWADGHMMNIERLGAELKSQSIIFVVDGIQSVGVVPTDVKSAQVDYFSGGMYKWLLGPYGLGYLYVNSNYCEAPALDPSWMSRLGADDFTQLTEYKKQLLPGAGRYHMGGKSSFVHISVANEAIQFFLDLGVENIQKEIQKKTHILAKMFEEKGYDIIAEEFRAPHMLSVRNINGGWSESFKQFLVDKGIHVSFRGDRMRITPHIYNTDNDVQYFLETVGKVL